MRKKQRVSSCSSLAVDGNNEQQQKEEEEDEILKLVQRAVVQSVLDLCGDEEEQEEEGGETTTTTCCSSSSSSSSVSWRQQITQLAFQTVHRTNSKNPDSLQGKPWDIEVRTAPALYYACQRRRRRRRQEQHSSDNNKNNNSNSNNEGENNHAVVALVSSLGLKRLVNNRHDMGYHLLLAVEALLPAGYACVLTCSANGFLCITSCRRRLALQQAGRLPCPHCPQWLSGTKGLWWHVQQQHHSHNHCHETTTTTTSAAEEEEVDYEATALTMMQQSNNATSSNILSSSSSSSSGTGGSSSSSRGHAQATQAASQVASTWEHALVVYNQNQPDSSCLSSLLPTTAKTKKETSHPIPNVDDGHDDDNDNDDIFVAAARGDLEALRRILRQNPSLDVRSARDKRGATALLWAAGGGHLDVVRWLIEERGCDARTDAQRGRRAFNGRTALHWACRKGHLCVARYLVEEAHVDLEACTADGTTAFGWAAWQGHFQVLQYLQERGCHVAKTNQFGCNAILWAAQGCTANNATTTKTLAWLQSVGCAVHLVNANGHGVLHKAAQRGNRQVCAWFWQQQQQQPTLLADTGESGGDDDDALDAAFHAFQSMHWLGPDKEGCTPSDLAGMEGHQQLAAFLAQEECARTAAAAAIYFECQQQSDKDTGQFASGDEGLGARTLESERTQQVFGLLPSWLVGKGNASVAQPSTLGDEKELIWGPGEGVERMRQAWRRRAAKDAKSGIMMTSSRPLLVNTETSPSPPSPPIICTRTTNTTAGSEGSSSIQSIPRSSPESWNVLAGGGTEQQRSVGRTAVVIRGRSWKAAILFILSTVQGLLVPTKQYPIWSRRLSIVSQPSSRIATLLQATTSTTITMTPWSIQATYNDDKNDQQHQERTSSSSLSNDDISSSIQIIGDSSFSEDDVARTPRAWLESLPDGAYTVLRCDLRHSLKPQQREREGGDGVDHNSIKSCNEWHIWGQDFHIQRLQYSYSRAFPMENNNNTQQSMGDPGQGSTVMESNITMQRAINQTQLLLNALLNEADKEFSNLNNTTVSTTSSSMDQKMMTVYMITLLWHPVLHRQKHQNNTSIQVCGHIYSTLVSQPMQSGQYDFLPKPMQVMIATSDEPDDDENAHALLPNRKDFLPDCKLSAWCRERKPLEARFKRLGMGEVLLTSVLNEGSLSRDTKKDLTCPLLLLEGLTSNVFCVYPGPILATPPADKNDGGAVLAGYARSRVLAAARSLGIPVEDQATLSLQDAPMWREVFVTSSIRLMVPVKEIWMEQLGQRGGQGGDEAPVKIWSMAMPAKNENQADDKPIWVTIYAEILFQEGLC